MALIINNNLMAANASRNLGSVYGKLSTSTQRLSSGLRVNSAADDAAGLAIREMMRADIATTRQGIRNAADAISLIQTADGALGVIDEKLTRMKELAEQASTGTYTTVQREIINSEYQAMAAEIDRIANATNFNGIKLLDGSINQQHGGQGLKVHFGVSNSSDSDYYFINIGDARATSSTGLRVGGDGKNDIWAQGGSARFYDKAEGCCAGGFDSLNGEAGFISGQTFSFGYNWDWRADDEEDLAGGRYTAGLWTVNSSDSLQDLVNRVNQGTQSRVGIVFASADGTSALVMGAAGGNMSAYAICVGDEAYVWGNQSAAASAIGGEGKILTSMAGTGGSMGMNLTSAINHNSASQFWAMWDSAASTCYVFSKEGGDNNNLTACEQGIKLLSAKTTQSMSSALGAVSFENVATGVVSDEGANFSLGGEKWGTMRAVQTKDGANELWNVVLAGRDVGAGRDIWIANIGTNDSNDLRLADTGAVRLYGMSTTSAINVANLGRDSFSEVQDASDAPWRGAEVRTQSSAQESLDALTEAIVKKDKIRADLGALQNRLENTMTNLEIQAENLQAAESRISDVDVATEMTEFTKNNVMAQAATAMLAQANSMNQLALSLL